MPEGMKDAMLGQEFENVLSAAAEERKEILTSCKTRAKSNYEKFYEASLVCRRDIEEILDKRKKDRTDEENDKVKQFKKDTSASFKQAVSMLMPVEEGEVSPFDKLADKVAKVLDLLRYVGCNDLDEAFEKRGIRLVSGKLEEKNDAYANQNVKKSIKESVETGVRIKNEVVDRSESIKVDKYEQIPTKLVYDKSANPVGIKTSDFTKLVAVKAKLLMASTEDAEDKAGEKANDMAGEKEFDIARARLVQEKLMAMSNTGKDSPDAVPDAG